MVEHCVQTSAVFLLGTAQRPSVPPPSPPSPLTPAEVEPGSPIEDLCLDDADPSSELSEDEVRARERLSGAVHVLNTEATALRALTQLYESDPVARNGFNAAVSAITRHRGERGKLVIIGVGKSGHIAKKLVATFNSLAVHATFLHPTEALHGDLGKVGNHDAVMFITFSGKTPELLTLLPHVDPSLPVIVLTSHIRPEDCELVKQRPSMILLPAPIHESETVSFGVSAPTTSTTMALAVGDALAVVASQELHPSVASVFAQNHPGGAIGAAFRKPQKIGDIAIPIFDIPTMLKSPAEINGADVLRAGYDSKSGWIRIDDLLASPGRIRQLETEHLIQYLSEISWVASARSEWITISADTRLSQAAEWIGDMQIQQADHDLACNDLSILAVMHEGDVVGVLEAQQLLNWQD